MNKRDLKKVILGQLCNMLRGDVIIDGIVEGGDMQRAWDAQEELAREFERRAAGASYAEEWNDCYGATPSPAVQAAAPGEEPK